MLMNTIRFLSLIIQVLLFISCSTNPNRNVQKAGSSLLPESNESDSLFLLSVTDGIDSDQVSMFSYYLDTLNSRLSVVGLKRQKLCFYRCYSIIPKESIEYDDNMEGHVKLILRNGLITDRLFLGTNVSIKHEYDSLLHLKGIEYVGGRKIVSWENDRLQRILYIDSTSTRFNRTWNIQYDSSKRSQGYSPELLNRIVADDQGEFLFACMGLFGQLPLGNDYIEERITNDYRGMESRRKSIHNESYSNNMIISSHRRSDNNRMDNRKSYSWNLLNLKYLSKLLND